MSKFKTTIIDDVLPNQSEVIGNRIAIFGLSANPPSGNYGHVGLVRNLVNSKKFDEIWILPVYKHIYASKSNTTSAISFEHRFNMSKLCFEGESIIECKVRVLSLERKLSYNHLRVAETTNEPFVRVGTVDVLNYLKLFYSNLDLNLILGSDTAVDLLSGKWKDCLLIFNMATLHIVDRSGIEKSYDKCPLYSEAKIVIHLFPTLGDISSTSIRNINLINRNKRNIFFNSDVIHPDVYKYICENNLYFESEESNNLRFRWLIVTFICTIGFGIITSVNK
jgi:nicotinic acid mononucleotide adenylyltransferase